MRSQAVIASILLASCGVRAPARIDVESMIRAHGTDDARHQLAGRIVADPKDIAARLALGKLEDSAGRPGAAIEQLEAVALLSGPIGTRWHADDRARLANLLAARGRVRLARGARTALADLERAAELGATIAPAELVTAKVAIAIARLRHVDAKERVAARRELAARWKAGVIPPASAWIGGGDLRAAWAGARDGATPDELGAFGVWAWRVGARRAAWEALDAWHRATPAGSRDDTIAAAYLSAYAWWTPSDGPRPADEELVGPDRCRYGACTPSAVLVAGDDSSREAILLAPQPISVREVPAWLELTLIATLRGDHSWGPAFAARVDLAKVPLDQLPGYARPAFALLAGKPPPPETGDKLTMPSQRLLVAAGRTLRGASADSIAAPLREPSLLDTDDAKALIRISRIEAAHVAHPFEAAALAYLRGRIAGTFDEVALIPVIDGYRRDPALAERYGSDFVARAPDAAVAQAALGALYEVLGDPARARAAWQAAVDSSPELAFQIGLAVAIARAKDPDAALVTTVTAAAASGDPAVVWTAVARALEDTGEHVHALDAARSAIGLGSGRTLLDAYDVAIDASRSLGRTSQVDELRAARANIAPAPPERPSDPTDAAAALAEHRRQPTAATAARLWIASRWNPRSVAVRAALLDAIGADDARRSAVVAELVGLASDRDPLVARDAVAALR